MFAGENQGCLFLRRGDAFGMEFVLWKGWFSLIMFLRISKSTVQLDCNLIHKLAVK